MLTLNYTNMLKNFRKMTFLGLACGAMMVTTSCEPKHNTLTDAEKAEGWQLLFDGQTLEGWKDYNGETLTQPWDL